MASFNNNTMRGLASNDKYTTDELETVTMDDGTRIVTSHVTDIKRPVYAGIDFHKSILMAAICVTNKETISAVFYVKQFIYANSDIRRMADWFTSYGVVDVCIISYTYQK